MAKELFTEWKPNQSSRTRLDSIVKVLEDPDYEGIKLTLRQLFYQLVSKNIIPNKQREYKNLSELLSKARLAGLVDWEIIEDRVRRAVEWQSFEDIQQCADQAAYGFRLPRWDSQPEYVEVWCEKDALSSVIQPICSELFLPFMVNRGYSSSSAMYGARERINENSKDREVSILYIGDFDPSGEDMVRDIRDRFETFGVDLQVDKLALNPDQVKKWKLPPNPAKMSDSRASGFVDKHGSKSYEVDAIPPKELQKLIRAAIVSHMDMDEYEKTKVEERRLRAKMIEAVEGIE